MWRRADPKTLASVRAALQRAERRATDPVAALDELGLLWTPHREREAKADAVEAASRMVGETALKLMTSVDTPQPRTPLDTQHAIARFLATYAVSIRQQDAG